MKKTLCVLIVLLLVGGVAMLTASADTTGSQVTFEVSAVETIPDGTAVVEILVTENAGFDGLVMTVDYDQSAMTLVSAEDAGLFKGLMSTSEHMTDYPFRIVYAGSDDTTDTGCLIRLSFHVDPDAEFSDYAVSISVVECINSLNESPTVSAISGTVSVIEQHSTIKCASVRLGTDISLMYYAELAENETAAQMRFTMHGNETVVNGKLNDSGMYVFTFTGVTPQAMGDNIKAELILGDKVLDTKNEYSVLQNCKNLLGKSAEDLGISADKYSAMQTLIADLMEYGAAAQTYRSYNAGKLVNADETIKALTPTEYVPLKDTDDLTVSAALEPEDAGDNAFVGAGVLFDYHNCLYVRFKIADNITAPTIIVNSEYYDGGTYTAESFIKCDDGSYIFVLDPMTADLMSFDEDSGCYVEYEIILKGKDSTRTKTFQTLYYSLASYVYSMQDKNTAMSVLAKAVYNYGLSAAAYLDAE